MMQGITVPTATYSCGVTTGSCRLETVPTEVPTFSELKNALDFNSDRVITAHHRCIRTDTVLSEWRDK